MVFGAQQIIFSKLKASRTYKFENRYTSDTYECIRFFISI